MTAINLDGAAVAITGGARGIGYSTAKAFAAQGASVYLGDLDDDLVAQAATELRGRLTRERVLRTLDATARAAYEQRVARGAKEAG